MKGEQYYWAARRLVLKPLWPALKTVRHTFGNYRSAHTFATKAKAAIGSDRVDLCLSHDVFALHAGAKTRARTGATFVADLVEIPSVQDRSGAYFRSTPKFGAWLQNRQHHSAIQKADHVLTIGSAMAEYIKQNLNVTSELVRNCPTNYEITSTQTLHQKLGLPKGAKCVAVVNGMSKGYGLENALMALKLLPDNVHIVLIGNYSPESYQSEIEAFIYEHKLSNLVHQIGTLEQDEYLGLISSADLGLLNLNTDILNMRLSLPNRFFDYLKAGLPFISTDIDNVAEYANSYDIGTVVHTPSDVNLANAISEGLLSSAQRRMRKNMQTARHDFTWDQEVNVLETIADSIPKSDPHAVILANKSIKNNKRIHKMVQCLENRGWRITVVAKDSPSPEVRATVSNAKFLSV